MKKQIVILIGMIIILGAMTSCGTDPEQEQFLTDLQNALETRWDISNKTNNNLKEACSSYQEAVDVELNALKEYKDKPFQDEAFKKIIDNYLTALESQQEGAKYYITNSKKFNELYYEKGYKVRSKCVNKLVTDYSFSVDSKYQKDLEIIQKGEYSPMLEKGEVSQTTSDFGDVKVSIDGFAKTNWNQHDSSELDSKDYVGVLKCSIENVSYNDTYNPNMISVDNFLRVDDEKYFTKSVYSMSYDDSYDGYFAVAGGFFKLEKGLKKKVAIPYILSKDDKYLIVTLKNGRSIILDIK